MENLKILSENDVLKFILDNRDSMTIPQLMEALGFKSRTSIINRLKKLGIKRGCRKGSLAPLLEDKLVSYYWMGFILADGHIAESNQLVVVSANKDKIHLEKLAYYLNTEVKTCKRTLSSSGSFLGSEPTYSRIAIQDKELGARLKTKFDISSQKTYNPPKNLNLLPMDYLVALIIGFIDGDGSIRDCGQIKIECHSSWREVLHLFKTTIENASNCSEVNISEEGRDYAYIQFKNETFEWFKSFIKKHSLPVMERKWY